MSPVEFKKRLCRPVEFKGQGPFTGKNQADEKFIPLPTTDSCCLEKGAS